ncbi:MAG TPA: septation regulator SpoVG [Actinobacteria bacterium]|nr:septation regulator SpoVG [Actinomycetota bacterium]
MEITKVIVRLVDMNKVRAVASVTFDEELVVHNMRIVEGDRGLFVAMPSRKLPNGEYRDVAHPINTEARERIQNAVLNEYEFVKAAARTKDGVGDKRVEEKKGGEDKIDFLDKEEGETAK